MENDLVSLPVRSTGSTSWERKIILEDYGYMITYDEVTSAMQLGKIDMIKPHYNALLHSHWNKLWETVFPGVIWFSYDVIVKRNTGVRKRKFVQERHILPFCVPLLSFDINSNPLIHINLVCKRKLMSYYPINPKRYPEKAIRDWMETIHDKHMSKEDGSVTLVKRGILNIRSSSNLNLIDTYKIDVTIEGITYYLLMYPSFFDAINEPNEIEF